MNRALWDTLLENARLRRELLRAHNEIKRQRLRADLWQQRATKKAKR